MSIINVTDKERELQSKIDRLEAEIYKYKNAWELAEREVQRMQVRIQEMQERIDYIHKIGRELDRRSIQK